MNGIYVLIFLTFFLFPTQKDPYYNKSGKPSTWGINKFVNDNHDDLINEYEFYIDTLYDVYIWTDNLGEYNDKSLGEFFIPDQITITNEEKYIAYEYKDLSKFKKKFTPYTDRTVKAVIFHELTHAYFYQVMTKMKQEDKYVSSEYNSIRLFPNLSLRFGSTFIEEGVCEYVVYYLNESAPINDFIPPRTETELVNEDNYINNVYIYSVQYLKEFLDTNGIEKGIEILIRNKPPSYQEMLNPKSFFERLN